MIERQIIIGLITSTEFLQRIRSKWNFMYIKAPTARKLAKWAIDYYDTYNKAPGTYIETIFYQKLKEGLSKDLAEEIEEDILPGLSEQYLNENENVDYLTDQTLNYFKQQNLLNFGNEIIQLTNEGKLLDAESKASEYKITGVDTEDWVDLSSEKILEEVEHSFSTDNECLIQYPKQIGEFWNRQLVRGGFVALLAPEKRGKTWLMLDMAIRGCKQRKRVAFFQAGDMTKHQQIKRICIYTSKKSDLFKMNMSRVSVRDCILNQLDECDDSCRESDHGVFETGDGIDTENYRSKINKTILLEKYKKNKDYKTCTNCPRINNQLGTIWYKTIPDQEPLTAAEAKVNIEKFFIQQKRRFKLSTHVNGTLTIAQMKSIMDIWQKQDGFIPDIIIVDYADLMDHPTKEFRHKQNEIWKGLRGISQERHALVITATQADADSYSKDLLSLKNFSEDKRKFAHVTSFYGLNQDHTGREKGMGLLRLNELVVREDDFDNRKQVYLIQNLNQGRPVVGSFW